MCDSSVFRPVFCADTTEYLNNSNVLRGFKQKLFNGVQEALSSNLSTRTKTVGVLGFQRFFFVFKVQTDEITAAKVFLKLREMDEGPKDVGLSDLLSDLDSW